MSTTTSAMPSMQSSSGTRPSRSTVRPSKSNPTTPTPPTTPPAPPLSPAAGKGEDAAKTDEKERGRWRKQALDWLRAALNLWAKKIDDGQAGRPRRGGKDASALARRFRPRRRARQGRPGQAAGRRAGRLAQALGRRGRPAEEGPGEVTAVADQVEWQRTPTDRRVSDASFRARDGQAGRDPGTGQPAAAARRPGPGDRATAAGA